MRLNGQMTRRLIAIPSLVAMAWCLSAGTTLRAQSTALSDPPPADPAAKTQPQPVSPGTTPLPVNLDYIKDQVQKQPAIKLDEKQLKFYVVVRAPQPFDDYAKPYDYMNGPTRGGAPMTYAEFLKMTRPKELDELFGSTSGSSFALAQAALVNVAGQAAIRKAIEAIRRAHDEHEIQAIRNQIDKELAALNGTDRQ